MGLYQSFSQVFVTNSPALLAEGKTVDSLAVGQIGLLDGKTYKAVTAPTYAKNKALYAVWGTPDLFAGDFSGVPNENEYSKLIKGKLIKKVRAKKAQRGQTPVYTIGWSGDVSDTDTLFADQGQSKSLFIKLSGTIIDRLYSKQGIIKEFVTDTPCTTDCTEACTPADCKAIALDLVEQINNDKDFKKFIRAKAIIDCESQPQVVTDTCYVYTLTVCDTGDAAALGVVQSQFPNVTVTVSGRVGSLTTYQVITNIPPAAVPAAPAPQGNKAVLGFPGNFVSTPIFVPDCPTCPDGYSYQEPANVFQVTTPEWAGVGDVESALGDYINVTLLSSNPSQNVFIVTTPTSTPTQDTISDLSNAAFIGTVIGIESALCVGESTETPWIEAGTLEKQAKTYRLTIADSICGVNRLADLQAAYPELEISIVDASGSCVHTYETSVFSNCYEVGCAIETIVFNKPAIFEGAEWVEYAGTEVASNCKCGIQLETAFFNVRTNECTFDYFPYENDIVHIQASNLNPDFNASPCEGEWAFKQIRQVKFPQGHGAYVQHLEKESKQYDQRYRSFDPVVREVQGYSLQADPNKFYDQYVIEFDTKFLTSGGWSESYTQSIHLNFFVPEGTGNELETALNSYVSSAGLDEDGVAI